MKKAVEQVKEFHIAGGHPVEDTPTVIPAGRADLRLDLIHEEYAELIEAVGKDSVIEIADALADLAYVTIGMALEYGIPLAEVFDEVHRSNMTKFSGEVRMSESGKILKAEGYEPPRLEKVLWP